MILYKYRLSLTICLFLCLFSVNSYAEKVWVKGWQETSAMTIARAGGAMVVHKNTIYMIGGVDGKNFLSSIESAKIKKDGSLSPWKVISELPEKRGFMSALIFKNRIYVVGGGNGEFGKNLLNSIVSAEISDDGGISLWRTEANKLLLPRRCSKLVIQNDKLIAMGGFGGALLDSVEYSHINSDGHLTPWQMYDEKLTMPRYVNSISQVNNKVFLLGGHHPRQGVGLTEVEYADLSTDKFKWQKTTSMASGRYAFSSFTYQNYLYVAGGISGNEYLRSIEKATITANIDNISWQKNINLPFSMANFTTIVVRERVYLLGGSSRRQYINAVWTTNINKNGDLGYWGNKEQQETLALTNTKDFEANLLVNAGTVKENINTEGYTYILVEEMGNQIWLAVPKVAVQNNMRIRYSEGVYMSNFFSKSLNRKFDSIIFAGSVRILK